MEGPSYIFLPFLTKKNVQIKSYLFILISKSFSWEVNFPIKLWTLRKGARQEVCSDCKRVVSIKFIPDIENPKINHATRIASLTIFILFPSTDRTLLNFPLYSWDFEFFIDGHDDCFHRASTLEQFFIFFFFFNSFNSLRTHFRKKYVEWCQWFGIIQ